MLTFMEMAALLRLFAQYSKNFLVELNASNLYPSIF